MRALTTKSASIIRALPSSTKGTASSLQCEFVRFLEIETHFCVHISFRMKYWSCCQRKTSEFDNFLNQIGCQEGKHLWVKKVSETEQAANCRFDHHQQGGFVVVTVYSKNPVPDQTTVKANKIKLDINIKFEGGAKSFSKMFDLYGVSLTTQLTSAFGPVFSFNHFSNTGHQVR